METIPQAFGRFRVETLLGKGAMGVVYKAYDPAIERPVAIKLIRADLLDGETRERYLIRFRNEARVAGRCVHPNIVSLYDFAMHEENPYLVMEYVEGTDLGRLFRRGVQVDSGMVIRIALQVLEALEYAHGFGIIHRDIKPANILLTNAGRLKVMDFGISRFAFETTQSMVMVGTPSYMSPEQCRGIAVDRRCDLFSLGCVMYELLSGQRAFAGDNYAETLYRLIHEAHRSLRETDLGIDDDLCGIVDRALAKQPEDRFESASQMAAALRPLIGAASAQNGGADSVDDLTTVVIPAAPESIRGTRSGTKSGSILQPTDSSSLSALERKLAHHIGPLAGFQVRRALREARSAEEFARFLGELVPQGEEQRSLIRDALQVIAAEGSRGSGAEPVGSVPPPADSDAVTTAFAEGVTRALMEVMGPIAPRLVQRARARAATRIALVTICAELIDNPNERERFMALVPKVD